MGGKTDNNKNCHPCSLKYCLERYVFLKDLTLTKLFLPAEKLPGKNIHFQGKDDRLLVLSVYLFVHNVIKNKPKQD